jgi:acetyl-CoA decarbonylase/synthase complex subunit gamma
MALSGLDIYKLLPKTNCKECGFPTCLAFAMKLSQKGAELSACPYVSDEAKAALEAASSPPIRLITIGAGENKIVVGNEVVLFRHEKTFYHEPGLVVRVADSWEPEKIAEVVSQVDGYVVERVGMKLTLNGIAVENASGDAARFAQVVQLVRQKTALPLVLMSANAAAMDAALQIAGPDKPLVYAATPENWQAYADLAKKYACPLAITDSGDLSRLGSLAESVIKAGVADLVLDPGTRNLADSLASLTQLRRLALKKNLRLLGFPILAFAGGENSSLEEQTILATELIAKYAGIVILGHFDPTGIYPLLTLRQNIYTDPQKPIQVSPGLYKFGEPGEQSPLLITTNFSLTYFTVAGEVEGSGVPSWLVIADSEGMSVLTAWAAGKFDAEKIAKSVKSAGMDDKLGHRKLVIPGYVATLSGEVEEELPGWQILVGPREAVDIPSYLKTVWKAA